MVVVVEVEEEEEEEEEGRESNQKEARSTRYGAEDQKCRQRDLIRIKSAAKET